MGTFISWIEHETDKNDICYLTYNDIYKTTRGAILLETYKFEEYLFDFIIGHEAIKFYHNIVGGIEKSCSNFSKPSNFPETIIKAIKDGEFRGLGKNRALLTLPAWKEFKKVKAPAFKKYHQLRQDAFSAYRRTQPLNLQAFKNIDQDAFVEYHNVEQTIFWDLFADKLNRRKPWR